VTKFCTSIDIRDEVTYATFGRDQLRGLGVARGRISRFPLTCVVALTTLSHYCASAWFCLLIGLQLSRRLDDRDEPQMLIRRDNCCQNNCCSTGKLPEFTQHLCINVMRVAGVVDSE